MFNLLIGWHSSSPHSFNVIITKAEVAVFQFYMDFEKKHSKTNYNVDIVNIFKEKSFMAEQKAEKPKEFSAIYFRAQCDGNLSPETKGTPQHKIHGHTAEFRIKPPFIICAFDGAASEETDETYPFKFHINILDDANHGNLERAWAIVVDVCAREGIGLVKVLNMGLLERKDTEAGEKEAKRLAETRLLPSEPSKLLTPHQEAERKKLEEKEAEYRQEAEIIQREQRRKKITVYCDRTNWQDATQRNQRVLQMRIALLMIQNRLRTEGIQPAELPAFDGRFHLSRNDSIQGSPYISIGYRSQASWREAHYVPHSSHIPGWDPFASYYRLPHPITADPKGQNPFHQLKDSDQEYLIYDMLEQLERNYPNVNDRQAILNMPDRIYGDTPLHLAAKLGRWQVYNALKHAGAKETIENKVHETPKQIAVSKHKETIAKTSTPPEIAISTLPEQKRPEELKPISPEEKKKEKKKHKKKEKKERKEAQLVSPSSTSPITGESKDSDTVFKKLSQFKPPQLVSQAPKPSEQVQMPSISLISPIAPASKSAAKLDTEHHESPMTTRLSAPVPTERASSALLAPQVPTTQQQPPTSAKPTAPSLRSVSPPQTARHSNKAAFSAGVTKQAATLTATALKPASTEAEAAAQTSIPKPSAPKGSS